MPALLFGQESWVITRTKNKWRLHFFFFFFFRRNLMYFKTRAGECEERWSEDCDSAFPGQRNKQRKAPQRSSLTQVSDKPQRKTLTNAKSSNLLKMWHNLIKSSENVVVQGALADGFWVIPLLTAFGYANKCWAPMETKWPEPSGCTDITAGTMWRRSCCGKCGLKCAASADTCNKHVTTLCSKRSPLSRKVGANGRKKKKKVW